MRIPSDAACKRVRDLWALANDRSSSHESANARGMLRQLQRDLGLSDFLLCYLIEREPHPRGEFDPIEIMVNLFEAAKIRLTPEQEIVVALWVIHTYVYDRYLHTPRLLPRSYYPGCGKTTLMSLLGQTASNSFSIANTSAAVIYRYLRDNPRTTFFIDEGEHNPALWSGDKMLINIFDNGHRYDGRVARVIRDKVVEFPCFAPLALAYVYERRELPPQSLDRSIPIEMVRHSEGCDEFEGHPLLTGFCAGMRAFAEGFQRPSGMTFPQEFTGRVLNNWRVLIELATVLGYPNTGRAAALIIQRSIEDVANRLLADNRRVFILLKADALWTSELLAGLHQLEDGFWNVFFGIRGNEDPHRLTPGEFYHLLRKKRISKARTVWHRVNGVRVSHPGYVREQFNISDDTATQQSNVRYLTDRVCGGSPSDN
jgi:uncharacterized protein DUF3631